jgi:hypothetical protein
MLIMIHFWLILTILDWTIDDDLFRMPVLDLRKLDDCTEGKPFYMSPPIFQDSVSVFDGAIDK